jgi:hypothetical protein
MEARALRDRGLTGWLTYNKLLICLVCGAPYGNRTRVSALRESYFGKSERRRTAANADFIGTSELLFVTVPAQSATLFPHIFRT